MSVWSVGAERQAGHRMQAASPGALGPTVHHRLTVRVHLHPLRDGWQFQQRGPPHLVHCVVRPHVLCTGGKFCPSLLSRRSCSFHTVPDFGGDELVLVLVLDATRLQLTGATRLG